MRKVLLASTALVLATGTAMAAGNADVQVTATVTASCTITDTDDVSFGANPSPGANDTSDLSFQCNFAGDGGEGALKVTVASLNGGLNNPADNDGLNPYDRSYTVDYNSQGAVAASALPAVYNENSAAPNSPNGRQLVVTLVDALGVAGTYSDTLTLSIVP